MKNPTITKFIDLMIGNEQFLTPEELMLASEFNFSDHIMLDQQDDNMRAAIDSTYVCERELFMDDVIFFGRTIYGLWGLKSLLDYVNIIIEGNSDILINSFEDKMEAVNELKANILDRVQQEEKVI